MGFLGALRWRLWGIFLNRILRECCGFSLFGGIGWGCLGGGWMGSGVGVDVGEEGNMMGVSLMGGTEV